jgi:hypothetical protein
VRTTVNDTLTVVNVPVTGKASLNIGLGWVLHVDEHGTTSTSIVTAWSTAGSAGNGVVLLLVGDDGVGTTLDTLVDVDKSNILNLVKGVRLLGRKLEQLLQVKDLDVMSNTFRPNNERVAEDFDLTPDDRVILGGKTTKVLELALLGNLREGSTVGLADGNLCDS